MMDYVVGNVAAIISGNVTPNRPKLSKRALTPIKHMPSTNVTPKSELVDDRSIFLSPSVQKKKAIVKKSPKRIFQNPDLDVTNENEGSTSSNSPKADKVKKHLKGELEATVSPKNNSKAAKTPEKTIESPSPKKKVQNGDLSSAGDNISSNELTPKKNKKKRNSLTGNNQTVTEEIDSNVTVGTPKKNKKKRNSLTENNQTITEEIDSNVTVGTPKKNKKKHNSASDFSENAIENVATSPTKGTPKKKKKENVQSNLDNATPSVDAGESVTFPKKNKKNKNMPQNIIETQDDVVIETSKKKNKKRKKQHTEETTEDTNDSKPKKKKKVKINPNAITDKDSDSEHESDNEIESETEENNKEVLENAAEAQSSSDEEEIPTPKKKEKTEETEKVKEINTEEEIKRTLFVGNVPFSKKCKKEIKKIFSHYGQIESVRIRTVPVKDPSVTPKLAVIKQELHPERSTVNVYVKFSDPQCVEQALAENNTLLNNNHLRVTRSGSTGADHDPRCSVFVGNIPFALEDEGLREKFEKCGEIESVRIVRDKKTNAGKGFGYVNFTSRDGVELALALPDEDLTIKNRIMRVKRCTQVTQRQAQKNNNRPGFQGKKLSQGDRQRNQAPGKPFNQGGKFQGNRPGNNFQGNRGGNFQGNRGGNFQGNRGGNFQGNRGGNFQGNRGGNFQNGGSFGRQNDGEKQDGAYRRLKHKRKSEEGGEGPPTKMPRDDQTQPREKKVKKEFVGMTAEKKKKRKFDKGQKKKKALSEILTK